MPSITGYLRSASAPRSFRSLVLALAAGTLLAPAARAATCPFDDGMSKLNNEGVILTRYALGLRGTALLANTTLAGSDSGAVEASIACPSCGLDINGDGVFDSNDALIISRKLAGVALPSLTNGISLGTGTRNTSAAVQSFLLSGCGSSSRVMGPNVNETQIVVTDRTSGLTTDAIRLRSVSDAALPTAINLIGGSAGNSMAATVQGGTIAGGGFTGGDCFDPVSNTATRACGNQVNNNFGAVGGGLVNQGNGFAAVVGGGYLNTVTADGAAAAIAGGQLNRAGAVAAAISGGSENVVTGDYGAITGGLLNTASGAYSTVGGGRENIAAGEHSWAGGYRAQTRALVGATPHAGSFVWADNLGTAFASTADNQFLARASNGAGINAAPPNNTVSLVVAANAGSAGDAAALMLQSKQANGAGVLLSAGAASAANNAQFTIDQYNALGQQSRLMTLTDGSNVSADAVTGIARAQSFVSVSDRGAKTAFAEVDARGVLEKLVGMPVTSWSYRNEQGKGVRHIGAVAQDFRKAFGLGYDDVSIAGVDADGVAFAAIKGLNDKLLSLLASRDAEISALKRKLELIERKLGIQ